MGVQLILTLSNRFPQVNCQFVSRKPQARMRVDLIFGKVISNSFESHLYTIWPLTYMAGNSSTCKHLSLHSVVCDRAVKTDAGLNWMINWGRISRAYLNKKLVWLWDKLVLMIEIIEYNSLFVICGWLDVAVVGRRCLARAGWEHPYHLLLSLAVNQLSILWQ